MTVKKTQAIRNLVSSGTEWSVSNNSEVTWHVVVGTQPTEEQIQAEVERLTAEAPWNELRAKRDQLLAATDWEIVKHKELGTNIPAALKTYRQELRDLPANTSDPANPSWPVKP